MGAAIQTSKVMEWLCRRSESGSFAHFAALREQEVLGTLKGKRKNKDDSCSHRLSCYFYFTIKE